MKSHRHRKHQDEIWLGLMIGNSRLHWAWFRGEQLQSAWDTQYLPGSVVQKLANTQKLEDLPEIFSPQVIATLSDCNSDYLLSLACRPLPLYFASVVPAQTAIWQTYPNIQVLTLKQVPLQNIYPTLGIDRALALWGAGKTWGLPMLVIDAGTALTFTGADANCCLVGGAILPGVGLQLQSLGYRGANLPLVDIAEISLPSRWALSTPEAMQSGVIYSLVAAIIDFIKAWWQKFPGSRIALTGGDRSLLLKFLQSQSPEIAAGITSERHLIFWGMRSYWASPRTKD